MKVLIFGANGQLGNLLLEELSTKEHDIYAYTKEQIDVLQFSKVKDLINNINPDVVINSSAYTNVDKAEDNKETAFLINSDAVFNIAKACKENRSWLFHISTDFIFDGTKSEKYYEDDKSNPLGVYGKSKLSGENKVISSGCKYYIIRTSWLFSEYKQNFLKTMITLFSNKKNIKVINDQFGTPTYARDLAISIRQILKKIKLKESKSEIFHYSGNVSCSWYDFANEIYAQYGKIDNITCTQISPITSSQYSSLAIRPKNSSLDSSKIKNLYGIDPSDWKQGIIKSIENLNKR